MRAIHGLWQGALSSAILTALLVAVTVDDADPLLGGLIGAMLGALIGGIVGLLAVFRVFKSPNMYAAVGLLTGVVCFVLFAVIVDVGAGEIVSNSETGIASGGAIGTIIGRIVGRVGGSGAGSVVSASSQDL